MEQNTANSVDIWEPSMLTTENLAPYLQKGTVFSWISENHLSQHENSATVF